jgi:hypothetical protein
MPRKLARHSVAICVLLGALSSACASKPVVPMKLIGLLQQAGDKQPNTAVFRDSASNVVFYGRKGDVIAVKYQIQKITFDSVELVRLGRGRRHIVLTFTRGDPAAEKSGKPQ